MWFDVSLPNYDILLEIMKNNKYFNSMHKFNITTRSHWQTKNNISSNKYVIVKSNYYISTLI